MMPLTSGFTNRTVVQKFDAPVSDGTRPQQTTELKAPAVAGVQEKGAPMSKDRGETSKLTEGPFESRLSIMTAKKRRVKGKG